MLEEHLALGVLHHWDDIPRVGIKLVPEQFETRSFYNPDKSGIEQVLYSFVKKYQINSYLKEKLEMWGNIFPLNRPGFR